MTTEQLQSLVDRATPGPWEAHKNGVHAPGRGAVASVQNPWNDEQERKANAELIARAPELARENIALLKQQDALREALEADKNRWLSISADESERPGLRNYANCSIDAIDTLLATQPKQPTEGEKDNG